MGKVFWCCLLWGHELKAFMLVYFFFYLPMTVHTVLNNVEVVLYIGTHCPLVYFPLRSIIVGKQLQG